VCECRDMYVATGCCKLAKPCNDSWEKAANFAVAASKVLLFCLQLQPVDASVLSHTLYPSLSYTPSTLLFSVARSPLLVWFICLTALPVECRELISVYKF